MSKAIRITVNCVRFGVGVIMFVARSPLALLAGVVGFIDRMVETLINMPPEEGWFAGVTKGFKVAMGEYLAKVYVVVAPAVDMIRSAWDKFTKWDF